MGVSFPPWTNPPRTPSTWWWLGIDIMIGIFFSSSGEAMQIKDMTTEQLQDLVRVTVSEALDEYFGDPDDGKEMKESFKQSLLEIRRKRLEGRPTIPASQVYAKYGIELK
jgi:hypothetical protein